MSQQSESLAGNYRARASAIVVALIEMAQTIFADMTTGRAAHGALAPYEQPVQAVTSSSQAHPSHRVPARGRKRPRLLERSCSHALEIRACSTWPVIFLAARQSAEMPTSSGGATLPCG